MSFIKIPITITEPDDALLPNTTRKGIAWINKELITSFYWDEDKKELVIHVETEESPYKSCMMPCELFSLIQKDNDELYTEDDMLIAYYGGILPENQRESWDKEFREWIKEYNVYRKEN